VFLEIPLDVQGSDYSSDEIEKFYIEKTSLLNEAMESFVDSIITQFANCQRPLLLLGGGVSRKSARLLATKIEGMGIPVMTTWNGMDRFGSDLQNYWGRPNTWGQRSSNILIQQCDLLVAVGTRLGLQQTGFAWEEFAPLAKIYQVDIDKFELEKGHPNIEAGCQADANEFLSHLVRSYDDHVLKFAEWLDFGHSVLDAFPLNDKDNITNQGYISPYLFVGTLSRILSKNDVIIPCSSGGAFTVTMQAFVPKFGQVIVTNKGLASMGYGLAGAIGAAESTQSRTILIEGDGGFAQNLQELGTLAAQKLNVKVFIFSNSGYASIRMTQRNYFDGAYLGCDVETGLGLPDWGFIAKAYGLRYTKLEEPGLVVSVLTEVLNRIEPEIIEVKIDPEQTYYPKISSRILPSGAMASNPLHLMTPDLSSEEIECFLPHLKDRIPK
jgi:acetolactate synthase-1/2/3 large subunit